MADKQAARPGFGEAFRTKAGEVLGTITGWAILALLLWWLVPKILPARPRDDTDPPGGRSNLVQLIDYGTGCQYLRAGLSGLTPRLDGHGQHMGCR